MMKQDTFNHETNSDTAMRVFYRNVKTDTKRAQISKNSISSPSKIEDIRKLINHIKKKKLKYPIDIRDSSMAELPRELCSDIIQQKIDSTKVRYLLSQFCDSLKGQQRSENKYAMLIYMDSSFLLAHVRAERGMSINRDDDEIGLIYRFLDIDNILSAALFEHDSEKEIVFSNFTDTGSASFRRFLGVSEKKYHYMKKNVQMICYYQGRAGLECKFEFSNSDFENVWLSGNRIELTNDRFVTESGNSHIIRYIRWGGEQYDSVRSFKADFKEYSYNLSGERRRYEDLLNSPSGSNNSVFDSSVASVIDKQHQIELRNKDDEREVIQKGTMTDDLHVPYANNTIHIDSGFANQIFTDILNNNRISLYHPSNSVASNELVVNGLSFLNIDRNDVSEEKISLLQNLHDHVLNLSGESVSRCLNCVFLHVIGEQFDGVSGKAIKQVINIGRGAPTDQDVVSSKENGSGGLIEYKNKQDLEKNDPASQIVENIKTERKRSEQKVFIWGITEQTRNFDGLRTQSWNDDRVSGIESEVNQILRNESIDYHDFIMQPISLGSEGNTWVVSGILH